MSDAGTRFTLELHGNADRARCTARHVRRRDGRDERENRGSRDGGSSSRASPRRLPPCRNALQSSCGSSGGSSRSTPAGSPCAPPSGTGTSRWPPRARPPLSRLLRPSRGRRRGGPARSQPSPAADAGQRDPEPPCPRSAPGPTICSRRVPRRPEWPGGPRRAWCSPSGATSCAPRAARRPPVGARHPARCDGSGLSRSDTGAAAIPTALRRPSARPPRVRSDCRLPAIGRSADGAGRAPGM
jgi:hypothetical protein